jgi:hypothetical protein
MFNIISGTGFRSGFSRELHKGEVTAAELCRKVLIDNGQENGYIGKWSEAGVLYYSNLHSRSCIKLQRIIVNIVEPPSTVFGILNVKLY